MCLNPSASNGGLEGISHFTYQLFNLIMSLPLSLYNRKYTPPSECVLLSLSGVPLCLSLTLSQLRALAWPRG